MDARRFALLHAVPVDLNRKDDHVWDARLFERASTINVDFLCIDALYFQDSGVWQPTVYQLIFSRPRRSYRNVCIVNQRKMRLAE